MKSIFEEYHTYQNLPHTCGPTCLKTILNYFGNSQLELSTIIDYTGCNEFTGTVGSGIENALQKLNIKFIRNPHKTNFNKSIELLNQIESTEQLFLMRTLMNNVKHWMVVYGKHNNMYLVSDPWLGLKKYNTDTLKSIWEPRLFDGFLIQK